MRIVFYSVEQIRIFVAIAEKFESDINIFTGRRKVDGKSIEGVLSLGLSNPLDIEIIEKSFEEKKDFINMLKRAQIDIQD